MHVDADEAAKVIYWMKGIYVSHTKKLYGKKKDYLGMYLDLSVYREIRVKTSDYPNKIVFDFP